MTPTRRIPILNIESLSLVFYLPAGFVVFGLGRPFTHAKDVTIRMTHVHLPNAPRHVCGRPRHVETLLQTSAMDGVDIIHPYRHPDPLVAGFVAVGTEGRPTAAMASAALSPFAQEDLARAGANAAECGRTTPVPPLLPAEFFEPPKAIGKVRNVQDRRHSVREHFGDATACGVSSARQGHAQALRLVYEAVAEGGLSLGWFRHSAPPHDCLHNNTRVHLQGALQRPAGVEESRPLLRALSGATRCCAVRCCVRRLAT